MNYLVYNKFMPSPWLSMQGEWIISPFARPFKTNYDENDSFVKFKEDIIVLEYE